MTLNKHFFATTIALLILTTVAGFLRYDATVTEEGRLQYAYNYSWESAAISVMKGLGFKNYPIPPYRNSGKRSDPIDYLTPEWEEQVDPDKLTDYTFGAGIPLAKSVLYTIFEPRHIYYVGFQQILTLLGVLIVFYTGRTFFQSSLAGLAAAALYAVCIVTVKHGLFLGREIYTLMGLLSCVGGAAWVLNHWEISPRRAFVGAAITGLMIGFFSLFRSTSLPFLFAFFLMMFFILPLRKGYKFGLVCVLAGLLAISPWLIRNKVVLDQFVMGQESAYLALWGGTGFNPNPIGTNATDTVSFVTISYFLQLEPEKAPKQAYYTGGAGSFEAMAAQRYQEYISAFPNTTFRAVIRNMHANMTRFDEVAYYDGVYSLTPDIEKTHQLLGVKPGILRRQWMELAHYLPYLAALGAIAALFTRPLALALLIPFLMTTGQISIAAAHLSRYSYHIIDIYYLFAGFLLVLPIDLFLRWWKKRATEAGAISPG